jgi:hypothetical protein
MVIVSVPTREETIVPYSVPPLVKKLVDEDQSVTVSVYICCVAQIVVYGVLVQDVEYQELDALDQTSIKAVQLLVFTCE